VVLKGQTRQVPQTPFFTTPSDGLFRISAYVVPTATGTTGNLYPDFLYQDEAGPEQQGFQVQAFRPGCVNVTGVIGCSAVVAIRAVAGSSISYIVSFDDDNQITTYDAFIVVERLE
jgi:hypothetical protein